MSALHTIAELMEIAAITAPKTKGENYVVVKTIEGDDLRRLGEGMEDYAERVGIDGFARDGRIEPPVLVPWILCEGERYLDYCVRKLPEGT